PRPRDKAQIFLARRLDARLKSGFLPDRGHGHVRRHTEFLLDLLAVAIPVIEQAALLIVDGADVVDVGRLRGTAPQGRAQDQNQQANCGHACSGLRPCSANLASNHASSSTGIPSEMALSSFEPAASPATTTV